MFERRFIPRRNHRSSYPRGAAQLLSVQLVELRYLVDWKIVVLDIVPPTAIPVFNVLLKFQVGTNRGTEHKYTYIAIHIDADNNASWEPVCYLPDEPYYKRYPWPVWCRAQYDWRPTTKADLEITASEFTFKIIPAIKKYMNSSDDRK